MLRPLLMLVLVLTMAVSNVVMEVGERTRATVRPSPTVSQTPTPHHDAVHDGVLRAIAAGDAAKPPRLPARVSRSRPSPVVKVVQPKPQRVIPRNALERLALKAANKWGISASKFFAVIKCESGWNPNAVGGGGLYLGLTQQHRGYWPARAKAAGYAGASAFDPEANLFTGAMLAAKGGWGHYGCA